MRFIVSLGAGSAESPIGPSETHRCRHFLPPTARHLAFSGTPQPGELRRRELYTSVVMRWRIFFQRCGKADISSSIVAYSSLRWRIVSSSSTCNPLALTTFYSSSSIMFPFSSIWPSFFASLLYLHQAPIAGVDCSPKTAKPFSVGVCVCGA